MKKINHSHGNESNLLEQQNFFEKYNIEIPKEFDIKSCEIRFMSNVNQKT